MKGSRRWLWSLFLAGLGLMLWGGVYFGYLLPRSLQREAIGEILSKPGSIPKTVFSLYPFGEATWRYNLDPVQLAQLKDKCLQPDMFKDWRRNSVELSRIQGECLIAQRPISGERVVIITLGNQLRVAVNYGPGERL